ncbi:MAG: hypothetical protein EBY00_04940 [Actinobacteria bacterium]|nr:hypothetical protein [Actinomycetota bacterium]
MASVSDVGPFTSAVISHHLQPANEVAKIAPQVRLSQLFNSAANVLFAEERPISSLLVGILA